MAVSRLPPHADSGRARYRAIVYFIFIFGRFFPETTLLSREDNHETTTSETPNRFPHDSVYFRLFPSVSVRFRLFPSNASRKLRGTPQRSLSKPEWQSRCMAVLPAQPGARE